MTPKPKLYRKRMWAVIWSDGGATFHKSRASLRMNYCLQNSNVKDRRVARVLVSEIPAKSKGRK